MLWKLMENLDVAACDTHPCGKIKGRKDPFYESNRDYFSTGVHWRVNFARASIAEIEKKY
jgi:hypothetical protein